MSAGHLSRSAPGRIRYGRAVNNLRRAATLAWLSGLLLLAPAAWPLLFDTRLPLPGLRNLGAPAIGWPLAIATLVLAAALSLWPLWTRNRLLASAGFCLALSLVVLVYVAMVVAPAFLAIARSVHRAAREGEPRPPEGALVPAPPPPPEPSSRHLAANRWAAAGWSWMAAVAFLGSAAWPSIFRTEFPLRGLRQLARPEVGWPLVAATSVLAALLTVPRPWNRDRLVTCGGFCACLALVTLGYASLAAASPFLFMASQLFRAGQDPGPAAPAPART